MQLFIFKQNRIMFYNLMYLYIGQFDNYLKNWLEIVIHVFTYLYINSDLKYIMMT